MFQKKCFFYSFSACNATLYLSRNMYKKIIASLGNILMKQMDDIKYKIMYINAIGPFTTFNSNGRLIHNDKKSISSKYLEKSTKFRKITELKLISPKKKIKNYNRLQSYLLKSRFNVIFDF